MKKRILFVEDDPLLVEMYVLMLERDRDVWDVATASDGPTALRMMEQFHFDVVVSDMRMPKMNGIELLTEVRTRYPRSSRIILSTLDDQLEVARGLGATHQFLPKPFNVKGLKAALARVGGLDAYLNEAKLQSLVGRLGALPSFPSVYVEIMKELDSANASLESIAAIIAKDPGMTAKMLQIVNSASVGFTRKVSSPFEAVQLLGISTVRSLALSAHVFSCFERSRLKGFSINRLWDHATRSGLFARRIMLLEKAELADAEDACTAGLLHDVGKLMLAHNLPEQFQQAIALASEENRNLVDAEQEIFGATHAGAAAYLLGLWGLPAAVVEAVAFHHTPSRSQPPSFGPLSAVHAANVLEHELSGAKDPGRRSEMDRDYLAAVGVADRSEAWRTEVVKQGKPRD